MANQTFSQILSQTTEEITRLEVKASQLESSINELVEFLGLDTTQPIEPQIEALEKTTKSSMETLEPKIKELEVQIAELS